MKFPTRALAPACTLALLLVQASAALAAVSPLSVSGNKILAGGQPASFSGNSLFWSNTGWGGDKFYNGNVVAWLKNDWKSRIVRVAMIGVCSVHPEIGLSVPDLEEAHVKRVMSTRDSRLSILQHLNEAMLTWVTGCLARTCRSSSA